MTLAEIPVRFFPVPASAAVLPTCRFLLRTFFAAHSLMHSLHILTCLYSLLFQPATNDASLTPAPCSLATPTCISLEWSSTHNVPKHVSLSSSQRVQR